MEEQEYAETVAQPQANPTEKEQAEQLRIPVKFNKESLELSVEEAAGLAQKGMKFDLIRADFERLRDLARRRNQSLPELVESLCREDTDRRLAQLLERCGDEELARHILTLEDAAVPDDSFAELQESFPQFSKPQDLPESVRVAAAERGTRLLDEYLRYRLQQKRQRRMAEEDRKQADRSAVGSQKKYAVGSDPVHAEFLRGVWGA